MGTHLDLDTNNGGNFVDSQLNRPVNRSQDNGRSCANKSLESRNGCTDGNLDRSNSFRDMGDGSVAGVDVRCQSMSNANYAHALGHTQFVNVW